MSRVTQPLFSRDDSTVEMRPELACSAEANCDGVCVPFMDSSRSMLNCSTMGSTSEFPLHLAQSLPHTLGIQFTNCFLLKSHKSTIHFPFAARQSAANTPRISHTVNNSLLETIFGTQ